MTKELATIDVNWAWAPYQPGRGRPWDRRMAAHLHRRAGFGATAEQLEDSVGKDPQTVVTQLVTPDATTKQVTAEVDQLAATILNTGSAENLAAVWLYRLLHTSDQLTEKATLFWHGHFATSAAKVKEAHLMHQQNQLLRKYALGDFGKMVQEISRDPAMLIYLDSATNRKLHPNENYAREVMELFCLGEGNYSEKDIQELARCFTGWEVRRNKFRFNRYQHDFGSKSVLGTTGKLTGEEAVKVILRQPAAPRFIARKLVQYFVFDEPRPDKRLIEPLARQMREDDLNVGPVIKTILTSNLFFSKHALARKIRSPIELSAQLIRALEGSVNAIQLSNQLQTLGQRLFYPPNVKGWDGGRTWINSSTLLGRANLVQSIVRDENTRFANGKLDALLRKHGITKVDEAARWFAEMLLAVPLPKAAVEQLVTAANRAGGDLNQKAESIVHTLGTQPEFQLC